MAPRRPAPTVAAHVAPAAVIASGPNFLDLSFYSGGFLLPKGRWCMFFDIIMHNPVNQQGVAVGKPRLGVMASCYNLDKLGEEPVEQFFSMGSKADLSFAPNETGKGLTPIPGAPATTAPRNTNWNLFLKSLYDCGLPTDLTSKNDITVLDGVWLVTDQVPEPEERKGYAAQAATGEAAITGQEERKGPGLTVVAVEILDGGKPWEGGGGVPATAAPVAVARPAAPARPGPVAAPARPALVAPAAPAAEAASTDDMETAVINGISSVLEAEPNGTTKLKARTGTFKYLNANGQAAVATQALNTYFGSDEALNGVLGALGYTISGANIVPAA